MGEANSAGWDAGAMAQFIAACRPIAKVWFRPEVRGLDTFPPGGALVVSNHSGGLHYRHADIQHGWIANRYSTPLPLSGAASPISWMPLTRMPSQHRVCAQGGTSRR